MFAFGRWEEIAPITDFPQGTPEFPDRAATLIVEVETLQGNTRLTGPGIRHEARLFVPDPEALSLNRELFPCGVDLFLTCGGRLAGLPRSVIVGG